MEKFPCMIIFSRQCTTTRPTASVGIYDCAIRLQDVSKTYVCGCEGELADHGLGLFFPGRRQSFGTHHRVPFYEQGPVHCWISREITAENQRCSNPRSSRVTRGRWICGVGNWHVCILVHSLWMQEPWLLSVICLSFVSHEQRRKKKWGKKKRNFNTSHTKRTLTVSNSKPINAAVYRKKYMQMISDWKATFAILHNISRFALTSLYESDQSQNTWAKSAYFQEEPQLVIFSLCHSEIIRGFLELCWV